MSFDCPRWPPPWPEIGSAIQQAVSSGQWGRYHSQPHDQLQQVIAESLDSPAVRLCASGSAAIEAALKAAGVGPGQEVILAAFDYPGNFRTIESVGAKPVLVDVDQSSLSLSPQSLAAAAGDAVTAVIASHLYGNAAEIVALRNECDERGWTLIEDACQVPGMKIESQQAGTLGHLGTFSFGGSKPLSAGNGGAILTAENRMAVRIDSLLDRPGDVSPLSALQCAALLPQWSRLDQCNQLRNATVRYLESEVLPQLETWQWLSKQQPKVDATHYKVAWAAQSLGHRAKVVHHAKELGLPIGEGFRAMARSSQRRCRKPVGLENAARFGETIFVLDHAALLLDESRHGELGEALLQLHRDTGS